MEEGGEGGYYRLSWPCSTDRSELDDGLDPMLRSEISRERHRNSLVRIFDDGGIVVVTFDDGTGLSTVIIEQLMSGLGEGERERGLTTRSRRNDSLC